MATPDVTVTITIDTTGWDRAMAKVEKAAERFADSLDELGRVLRRSIRWGRPSRTALERRRDYHGGNARDAHTDQWQSAVCSAWLHDSCPSDAHRLSCSCTCHRKADR